MLEFILVLVWIPLLWVILLSNLELSAFRHNFLKLKDGVLYTYYTKRRHYRNYLMKKIYSLFRLCAN